MLFIVSLQLNEIDFPFHLRFENFGGSQAINDGRTVQ